MSKVLNSALHHCNLSRTMFKMKLADDFTPMMGPKTRKLLRVLKRDGMRCDCCGADNLVMICNDNKKGGKRFRIYARKGNRKVPMTLDHDMLDCLGGSNSDSNMHSVCEDCNSLRQHVFAEYAEFKYWYHNGQPEEFVPNYCFVDFTKNAKDTHMLKVLNDVKEVPQQIRNTLIRRFSTGKIDVYKVLEKSIRNFETLCFNELLNECVYFYLSAFKKIDNVEIPCYNYVQSSDKRLTLPALKKVMLDRVGYAIGAELNKYRPKVKTNKHYRFTFY